MEYLVHQHCVLRIESIAGRVPVGAAITLTDPDSEEPVAVESSMAGWRIRLSWDMVNAHSSGNC